VFRRVVHFWCGKKVRNKCLELTGEKMLVGDPAMCVRKNGEVYVFVDAREETQRVVAHECLHAANYIIDMCGMKVSAKNDELSAYLMDYLIEQWYEVATA